MDHSAVPHAAVDDDMYGGFHIPKGEYLTVPCTTECLLILTSRCYRLNEPVVRVLYIISNLMLMIRFARAMGHDESRYPNPHAFMPERFLNDDGSLKPNDIEHIAYGFGRRICVGRHFADTSVWSVMAKVLAVFKILRPLDENGVEIPVEPRFSTGNVM